MFVVIVMSVNVREMFHTGPLGRGFTNVSCLYYLDKINGFAQFM